MNRCHLACVFLVLLFSQSIYAQINVCTTSQRQQTVSGAAGNALATNFNAIYDSSLNQFTANIFNNNQILTNQDCPNFNTLGNFISGLSTFYITMTCTGPENNGLGIGGQIHIPINGTLISAVNIPNGQTYKNVPIKPSVPTTSLANRQCTLNLYTDLFALTGSGCQPCYSQYVRSQTISTGFTQMEDCGFFNLPCYGSFLWQSTFFWIVMIWAIIFVSIIIFFWFYADKIRGAQMELLNHFLSTLRKSKKSYQVGLQYITFTNMMAMGITLPTEDQKFYDRITADMQKKGKIKEQQSLVTYKPIVLGENTAVVKTSGRYLPRSPSDDDESDSQPLIAISSTAGPSKRPVASSSTKPKRVHTGVAPSTSTASRPRQANFNEIIN